MEDIVCKSCGSVNNYSTSFRIFKDGTKHKEATCNDCGKHIRFVPQNKERTFIPFGKYKGKHTYEVDDFDYLKWIYGVVDDKRLKLGITKRLRELNGGCGNG